MAEVKGVLATAMATGGVANFQLPGIDNGRVKCSIDSYEADGTEVAGTTIRLFADGTNKKIPAGANIIALILTISASEAGLTISAGDDNSATRYANATAFATASGAPYVFGGKGYIIGTNPETSEVSGDNGGIVLTTGGATLTDGTVITGVLLYSVD